jgi:carboxyl-terminal processing protease
MFNDKINPMTRDTKKKILSVITVVVLGAVILGSGIWIGWNAGRKYPENIVVNDVANIQPNASTTNVADFSTFWAAWQDINNDYLRTPSTTPQKRVYGAIDGMIASLGDPYTEFFTPADSKQFQQDITGNFGGIGAQLGTNSSTRIVVMSAIAGTPASAVGLKPEDVISAINGSSTDGMNVDDAVNLIRGVVGTKVTLSIVRGTNKPQDFTITRSDIQVPTVDFSMKGHVAYIALHEFTQDANSLFYQALQKAMTNNAQGIVLDLRDDPGGYLETAVDLSGYFLKPGSPVVKEIGRTVAEQDYQSTGSGALSNMPMAILINGGSASAAEILSGALHDDRKVPLVGEKSFGKGTVQQLENLPDGSSLKITVAHWVLPSGRILDHDGLVPDYAATLTDAEIKSGQDPQLDKALEVVRAQINGTTVSTSTAATTIK